MQSVNENLTHLSNEMNNMPGRLTAELRDWQREQDSALRNLCNGQQQFEGKRYRLLIDISEFCVLAMHNIFKYMVIKAEKDI